MDYDKIFEQNIDRKFFYTDYRGKKMVVGKISLTNAMARLSKDEYYTLVTYQEGEELPEEYIPLNGLESNNGTLFATYNPDVRYLNYICRDGGIQIISRLPDLKPGNPRYLLGPGPETITLEDLIMEQYNEYIQTQESSIGRGR